MSSILFSMVNATNTSTTITRSIWNVATNPTPLDSHRFNISKAEETQLKAQGWTIIVTTPTHPTGEISGQLALAIQPVEVPTVPITWWTWLTLSIIVVMLIVLGTDYFEPWFVIFLSCLVIHLFGILSLSDMESAFSQEAMLTVIFLIICVEPLQRSSVLALIAKYAFGKGTGWFWSRVNLLRICVILGCCSGFLSNAAMVVLFTPIVKDWCRKNNIPASKFLMPMLGAIISGGDFTTIGSSTNILVSGFLKSGGFTQLGFFELSYIALPCFAILMIYNIIFAFWLLPDTGGMFRVVREDGREFLLELIVVTKSKLIGKTVKQVKEVLNLSDMQVAEIIRRAPKRDSGITSPSKDGKEIVDFISPKINPGEGETEVLPGDLTVTLPDGTVSIHRKSAQRKSERSSPTLDTVPVVETDQTTPNMDATLDTPSQDDEKTVLDTPSSGNGKELMYVPMEKKTSSNSNDVIQIFPVEDTQVVLEGDRLIFSGEVQNILRLHHVPGVENMIKFNSHFDFNEMTGKVQLDTANVTSVPQNKEEIAPKVETTITVSELKTNTPSSTWREKFTKYVNKLKFKKNPEETSKTPEFFEVVISRDNPCIGSTLKESNFTGRYECAVLAIRKTGDLIKKNLDDHVISPGDTILILSKTSFYIRYVSGSEFYIISRLDSKGESPHSFKVKLFGRVFDLWWYQLLCFPLFISLIIVVSLSNNLNWGFSMARTALVLVAVFVLVGINSPEQTVKSVSVKLIILIGFSITLGKAVTNSGLATAFGALIQLIQIPPYIVPALFLLMCMIVTQFVHTMPRRRYSFPWLWESANNLDTIYYHWRLQSTLDLPVVMQLQLVMNVI
jgi:di/tricarboxylate transporter